MTCAVAATHMLMHRWEDSPQRYQILVILSLPAVYAVLTGLEQVLPGQALYLSVCAEIYEGLGLITFLMLLRSLAGGDTAAEALEHGDSVVAGRSRLKAGIAMAAPSYECMAATLPIYKIAFLILATVDATQHLGLGSFLSRLDLVCSFMLGCVALTAIGQLLAGFMKHLGRNAMPLKHKFWAVKGMVTVMFNQSLLLWAFGQPLQHLLALLDMQAREDFESTLVALEMLLLALWHTVAFPISGEAAPSKRLSSRSLRSDADRHSYDENWLWPWTVAQMTVLASCLFVQGVDVMYHVWFVLACALCILVAFGCQCMRPLRRMVVVGAVGYLYAVYLIALGGSSNIGRCLSDDVPLSANGLAQSTFNCTEQLGRGGCKQLWLQGFCCSSCGLASCPHCSEDATTRAKVRSHDVLVGVCMALTATVLALLVRVGYVVLDCDGNDHSSVGDPSSIAMSSEYLEMDSDREFTSAGG
eukprot:CAMPEP_0172767534 /NCGR_PEP_ID=MMETSP1074-20121228/183084_1 /TAXON_ID=2916 /ORGANISM="Ceratium fusus, Strain PA161109" /LENGTH=471 /DNA_ID=CAMNT_0013602801 /DNA_START=89 /DNA_END=1504 /DNA_ORIENTATION=-